MLPALSAIAGLLFAAGVQAYSMSSTEVLMQRVEERQQAQAAADAAAFDAFLVEYEKQQKVENAARAAAAREAMLAALPGDPKKGRMTYMTCLGCHGLRAEGSRGFKAPRLAGQQPWYLKGQLEKFRAGQRGAHPTDLQGQQMAPMAKMLAGTAIDDVIAYIVGLEPKRPADQSSGNAEAGAEAYAICATCHGSDARGLQPQKGPRLSHQHAWYLEKQLQNFRGGVRGAHAADLEGQQMAAIARTLGDDQSIADLIAFIQSLNQ